jgi:hypothetical protein
MKDELIAAVAEKAGIAPAQAETAVDAVLGYLKEHPDALKELGLGGPDLKERLSDAREKIAPVAEKGKEALGEAKERVGPLAAKGKERFGEAREKLAPKAQQAGSSLGGRLRGLMKRDKNGASEDEEPAEEAAAPKAE